MRRVKEIFLGYLLPIIAVLTIDILVMARLATLWKSTEEQRQCAEVTTRRDTWKQQRKPCQS